MSKTVRKKSSLKSVSRKPAFGTSIKRFGKITVHPALDPSGLYATRPLACDPCYYEPIPIDVIFEVNRHKKIVKDPWRYKNELEDWAQNLGYRNQKILEERRWQDSLLGPAWTEVPDPTHYEPACKNVNFGRTPRFKPSRNSIPGPGTYYKENPYKAPYGPHSTRPTLEREEACRFKDLVPRWCLAPNRYSIIDRESIEQKSNKIVSKKGPYSLFTGKRDGSTIKNHFSTSLKCSAAHWPMGGLPGSLETYKKRRFGEMNKTNRDQPYRGRNGACSLAMCVRKFGEPTSTTYDVDKPKEFVQYKYGFNSSYDRPPGYMRVVIWPGVGRYTIRRPSVCGLPGNGHRHVFLSKVERTIGSILPEKLNTF